MWLAQNQTSEAIMSNTSKKTPLHDWHLKAGANMANFGGYQMPLWYSSAKNEHLSVLTHAGLFDTSHMAVITVRGSNALDLLQHCFTNDLASCIGPQKKPLHPGRCVYGAFLNETGGVLDDAIIFHIAESDYMVVVNAGMGAGITDHLKKHMGERQAAITDWTDQVGKMDIQGPMSVQILQTVLEDPAKVFEKMPYFGFKGHFQPDAPGAGNVRFKNDIMAMVSRTGYTGEIGFEIFCAAEDTIKLWEMIMEAGQPLGLLSCGLAARDSLRAGAVLPLSHQDIGAWPFVNNPWPFALPYTADQSGFTKSFIGDKALENLAAPEYTHAFAGYNLRKVSISDPAEVLDENGQTIGTVLTCATDMGIHRHQGKMFSVASEEKPSDIKFKGLCCGFVKVDRMLKKGQQIELKDKRRTIKVEIVQDIRPNRTARHPLKHFLKINQ